MPNQSVIVLNDNTPAAHNYEPESRDNGVSTFVEVPGGVFSHRSELSSSARTQPSGHRKMITKLRVPVLGTDASGNTVVLDYDEIKIESRVSPLSATAARQHLFAQAQDLCDPAGPMADIHVALGTYY